MQYVDEVVIGAPFSINKEMIEQLKIQLVVHGDDEVPTGPHGEDPYAVHTPRHSQLETN